MGIGWRTAVGAVSGVAAAVVWALSVAIYQPFMQPHGFWTDTTTGQTFPQLGGNNTYWPRDIRQLAILLAFLGMILICRASVPGVIVGAVVAAGWLGVDLWLDRSDVAGRSMAVWLAAAGIVGFSSAAAVATRVSVGRTGTAGTRHLSAVVAATLCATTMLVTTPWDEPVVDADRVRVEDASLILKAVLALMFVAVAIGLVATRLTAVLTRRLVFLVACAGFAAWRVAASGDLPGVMVMFVAMTLAVSAAQGVPLFPLCGVAAVCVVAPFVIGVPGFVWGSTAGAAMTSLAGNPPVNGADTDMSLTVLGLLIALPVAALSYLIVRAAHPTGLLAGGVATSDRR